MPHGQDAIQVWYYNQYGEWRPYPINSGDTLDRVVVWVSGWGFKYRISLPIIH